MLLWWDLSPHSASSRQSPHRSPGPCRGSDVSWYAQGPST